LSSILLLRIIKVHLRGLIEGNRMDWKILLACITGSVDEELLLRNE